MRIIQVDDIDIEITRKDIKHIYLKVKAPDGRVMISVPKRVDDKQLRIFIESRIDWIKVQTLKFKTHAKEEVKEFISGEYHYLFGEKKILNVMHTKSKQRVEFIDKEINLYVRCDSTSEGREKIITEGYRLKLKSTIPKYIDKWEAVMALDVNEWNVKKMKTRWGTCNIQAKRIWINLELVKKPERCLEYIVVHEMVHLFERYHNNNFKALMDKYLPNWKEIKEELNGVS